MGLQFEAYNGGVPVAVLKLTPAACAAGSNAWIQQPMHVLLAVSRCRAGAVDCGHCLRLHMHTARTPVLSFVCGVHVSSGCNSCDMHWPVQAMLWVPPYMAKQTGHVRLPEY
jgi:hypothetical protein